MSEKPFKKPSAKEIAFLKGWKSTRLAKWKYIFSTGAIWGLMTALLKNLILNGIDLMAVDWRNLAIEILVFCIGGVGLGYWLYVSQEKRYQEVLERAPDSLEES